jgi:hypothetical protein
LRVGESVLGVLEPDPPEVGFEVDPVVELVVPWLALPGKTLATAADRRPPATRAPMAMNRVVLPIRSKPSSRFAVIRIAQVSASSLRTR